MAKPQEESGGNWMDTYADMVTLLLTFFVMLYSMSSVVEEKWSELVRAFNSEGTQQVEQIVFAPEGTGAEILHNSGEGLSVVRTDDETQKNGEFSEDYTIQFDDLFSLIERYIEENNMSNDIEVVESTDLISDKSQNGSTDLAGSKNIYIQFKNNVLFEPDKAVIKSDSQEILEFLGECLKGVENQIAFVVIKGHTASSEYSEVDARLLSTERAGNISNFFEDSCNLPSTMLVPLGLAGDYPIADNSTEEGRAKNRRVEICIIGKNSQLVQSGEILKILGASFASDSGDIGDIVREDASNNQVALSENNDDAQQLNLNTQQSD